jgi:hypothetical protein
LCARQPDLTRTDRACVGTDRALLRPGMRTQGKIVPFDEPEPAFTESERLRLTHQSMSPNGPTILLRRVETQLLKAGSGKPVADIGCQIRWSPMTRPNHRRAGGTQLREGTNGGCHILIRQVAAGARAAYVLESPASA